MEVTVLIPVLGRPERVEPLLASLEASGDAFTRLYPLFLCSPSDDEQISAISRTADEMRARLITVPWEAGSGDYARKMNLGFEVALTEWVFFAADDLLFHPGWAAAALREHDETGACVIGTNDLGNSRVIAGLHSTHSLVHRDYAECGAADDSTRLLHEGYDHNFVDTEFVQTAIWRETFSHCARSVVEHLHPDWGKGTVDRTYEKGKRAFGQDRDLFNRRKRLFGL